MATQKGWEAAVVVVGVRRGADLCRGGIAVEVVTCFVLITEEQPVSATCANGLPLLLRVFLLRFGEKGVHKNDMVRCSQVGTAGTLVSEVE